MTDTKPIRRIAIVGTGVIGASWTALFLAKGLQVVATDIAPNAEASLRKFVQKKLIDSVHAEVGSRSIDELAAERDEILLGLVELRTKGAKTPTASKASARVA